MLAMALESSKVSFDGREPGDIFVYMQEVDAISARFSVDDLSEEGRCRIAISGMQSPARETTATDVMSGKLTDNEYATFADGLFNLYMKSATAIETNIRIWNLSQKHNENSTAWGARCLRAMIYRLKKDVSDCARHQTFMRDQDMGLTSQMIEEEYGHCNFLIQAYLEATQQRF